MGTALIEQGGEPYWLIFNIGDSRAYLRSRGTVTQVSVDHSVVQELIDAGRLSPGAARLHPERSVITRAVGSPQQDPAPDFWLLPAGPGDRLVLCSDGVTSEIEPDDVTRLVVAKSGPQDLADALVRAALSAGGRDNITAVVVDAHVEHDPAAPIPAPDEADDRTLPRVTDVPADSGSS